ncbi:ATP-binding cassette domain-containing protein, partial [Bauldia litoralis]
RPIATLSGGNQQKVVIARWLTVGRRVLVLEEPTTGVDVGAKAEIYRLLNEALSRKLAVLLVSSDFEEVAGLSDRALVFSRGQTVAEVPRADLSVKRLTALASGGAV